MYKPKFNNNEEESLFWKAVEEYLEEEIGINKLAKKYSLGNKLRYFLQKNNLTRPKQRQDIDHNYFNKIDTEEKAYWLGFIYADGNISDYTNPKNHKYCLEITLKSDDKSHLELFKKHIGYEGEVTTRKVGKYEACRISFSSKELILDLVKLGCTPRKSLTLKYPLGFIPKHLERHFIRGYFDGDGSVNTYNVKECVRPKINLSILGTEHFLNNMQEVFLRELEVTQGNLYSNETRGEVLEYKKAWKQAMEILHYIYDDSNIYLDRKYSIFKEYCRLYEKS